MAASRAPLGTRRSFGESATSNGEEARVDLSVVRLAGPAARWGGACWLWELPDMMSASEGKGSHGKADAVKEGARIPCYKSVTNADQMGSLNVKFFGHH